MNFLWPPTPPLFDYVSNTSNLDYPAYLARAQQAAKAAKSERVFDIYYVALRRSKSTDRFARQDTSSSNLIPSPYFLASSASSTATALPPAEDVMLPVPWRVQIEVPQHPNIQLASQSTGVPTEVLVPPNDFPGDEDAAIMLVQMFPAGAYFVDEINGQVYKVVRQRIVDPDGEGTEAVLTLDREITLEDVQIPGSPPENCDPRFGDPSACTDLNPANPKADPQELLRTVWVFPPPTAPRDDGQKYPTFDGPPPVVSIEVRSLSILP